MIPTFIYGTAWKEEATERLTRLAIDAGFRAIDTANQRRHYVEAGVGAAVAGAIRDGVVQRDELFLQTKFTSASGQDHRMPFDPKGDPAAQVRQSFASSLEHLQVESIDSYVLRGAAFREIVARVRRTPAQVVFRFARQIGILPLTGTTDPEHMREDLAIDDFELSADDVATIAGVGSRR